MHNAVDALIEIGVTDEERIIKFLQKYGDMRESEAKAASKEIITVEIPSKRLVGHLVKQGYTDQEVANFMKSNMARIKLRHDPKLGRLKPAEMVKQVKDNAKEKD